MAKRKSSSKTVFHTPNHGSCAESLRHPWIKKKKKMWTGGF